MEGSILLAELEIKESRGWKYKELVVELPEKQEENKRGNEDNNKPLEGIQINMFSF